MFNNDQYLLDLRKNVAIYNSFSKQKENLVTIENDVIKMYVCGQTVYDFCHLGHARKAIVFDMIRRWFITIGYKVVFVENITDIDDKIIKRAEENKETIYDLTERIIGYMYEDFDRLGVLRPDHQPKATEFVPQMLSMIETLIDKGYAYQAVNGDVYYRVRKFASYGKLSGKSIDDLNVGERVEIDNNKEDPLDFVLWKSVKGNEPSWESSFGNGRPGWHIECSAMSENILGKNFDIHGGGQDLQFPHHENEIAQSEAHNDCKFANYWMHNGFLNINDEKMSKSLGNFLTLRDVLNQYDGEVLRLFMLKTHYRSPLNFNHDNLEEAKSNLAKLYMALKNYTIDYVNKTIDFNNTYTQKFVKYMNDDFNTSAAIGVLYEICTEINKANNLELAQLLFTLANSIGLVTKTAQEYLQGNSNNSMTASEIEALIIKRKEARANKDFALSDKIRNDLLAQGVILEDSAGATTWRYQ